MNSPILSKQSGVISQKNRQKNFRDIQRLAELGRLSATLLHEISNPLTAALLCLEPTNEQPANIKEAKRNLQLLKRYVEAARQQVRLESSLADFSLKSQFSQVKRILLPLARKANVRLIIDPLPHCRLYGDPVKFQQILAKLIVNAIEAYAGEISNDLEKLVRVSFVCDNLTTTIMVIDKGQGIPSSKLAQVFEPFYTTKSQSGHGLGIGLAIVRQYVVEDFKGSISVRSSRRLGTVFTIKLPALHRL